MANSNGWGDGSVNNSIGWGQGANNAIGWGKSQLVSASGLTDIDGGNAPSNSVAPALSGTAQEGQTLTCSTGTWSGSPTYTYQWKRDGSNITSATNSTYTLVTADVGTSIKCTVTATNFSGSADADSNTVTPTSAVDADAQAFITAASITDNIQKSAINQLVVDLKAYSLWTKYKVILPFVGGNASAHAVNLKTPGTFNSTFASGWTHSANGVQSNGATYMNTLFNMSTQITSVNNWAVGFYVNLYTSGAIDMGADSGISNFYLTAKSPSIFGANTARVQFNDSVNYTDSVGTGFYLATRNSSTNGKAYRNGTEVANLNNASAGSFANYNVYLGALNRLGTAGFNTNMRYAFMFIANASFNATEQANMRTAVQTFQTTLSRQV